MSPAQLNSTSSQFPLLLFFASIGVSGRGGKRGKHDSAPLLQLLDFDLRSSATPLARDLGPVNLAAPADCDLRADDIDLRLDTVEKDLAGFKKHCDSEFGILQKSIVNLTDTVSKISKELQSLAGSVREAQSPWRMKFPRIPNPGTKN